MRSVRVGLVAVAIGAIYLVVPYREARNCLGMECLRFLFAAAPVAVLSQPWSMSVHVFDPETESDPGSIYRGKLLHPDYMPRYLVFVFGYLLNIFLAASGLHAAYRWIRRSRRGGMWRRRSV